MKNQNTTINKTRERLYWLSAELMDENPLNYLINIKHIITTIEEIELVRSEDSNELIYIYRQLGCLLRDYSLSQKDEVLKSVLALLGDHFKKRAEIIS